MSINNIFLNNLHKFYADDSDPSLPKIGEIIDLEIGRIISTFYLELLEIPEIRPILENAIVRKNLPAALKDWIQDLFTPKDDEQVLKLVDRQKQIGAVHANINLHLSYFTHGINILKREIFNLLDSKLEDRNIFIKAFSRVNQLFDILVSIICDAFFSNEIVHETNELSMKMKGVTQNTANESGDSVLKQFAEMLLISVRTSDFIFRYGGEEFLVLLGNVDKEEAGRIAEKIRGKCEHYVFHLPGNQQINKTCSIGIASYEGHPDYQRIVRQADAALYKAKQEGRNRVVMDENGGF